MDAVFPFSFAFVADYLTLVRVLSASFNMFQSEERYGNILMKKLMDPSSKKQFLTRAIKYEIESSV